MSEDKRPAGGSSQREKPDEVNYTQSTRKSGTAKELVDFGKKDLKETAESKEKKEGEEE